MLYLLQNCQQTHTATAGHARSNKICAPFASHRLVSMTLEGYTGFGWRCRSQDETAFPPRAMDAREESRKR